MKISLSLMVLMLSVIQLAFSQIKTECFTDVEVLITDDYRTLGIFEYKDGSIWFVTEKGISIFSDDDFKTVNKANKLVRNPIGAYLKG